MLTFFYHFTKCSPSKDSSNYPLIKHTYILQHAHTLLSPLLSMHTLTHSHTGTVLKRIFKLEMKRISFLNWRLTNSWEEVQSVTSHPLDSGNQIEIIYAKNISFRPVLKLMLHVHVYRSHLENFISGINRKHCQEYHKRVVWISSSGLLSTLIRLFQKTWNSWVWKRYN